MWYVPTKLNVLKRRRSVMELLTADMPRTRETVELILQVNMHLFLIEEVDIYLLLIV